MVVSGRVDDHPFVLQPFRLQTPLGLLNCNGVQGLIVRPSQKLFISLGVQAPSIPAVDLETPGGGMRI